MAINAHSPTAMCMVPPPHTDTPIPPPVWDGEASLYDMLLTMGYTGTAIKVEGRRFPDGRKSSVYTQGLQVALVVNVIIAAVPSCD